MNIELCLQNAESQITQYGALTQEVLSRAPKKINDIFCSAAYMRAWQWAGRKTFIISDKLLDSLWHTNVPENFHFSDLKFPFDSFCLLNDSGLLRDNEVLDPVWEEGMSSRYTHIFFVRMDTVYRWHQEVLNLNQKIDFEFDRQNDFVIMPVSEDENHKGYYDFVFLPFKFNQSFEDAKKEQRLYRFANMEQVFNLCINTVLYINDPSRRPESQEIRTRSELTRPKEKGKKRFANFNCIYLKPPSQSNMPSIGTGRKIEKRFIVRGHWRNQAYGEKHGSRRYAWIKPHWKGPSMAEVVHRSYLVQ